MSTDQSYNWTLTRKTEEFLQRYLMGFVHNCIVRCSVVLVLPVPEKLGFRERSGRHLHKIAGSDIAHNVHICIATTIIGSV